MSARDEILSRLRGQARDVSPPAPWRSRRHFDDLATRFVEALTAAKGEVRRAGNLEEALSQLAVVLHEIEARSAVADAHPPLDAVDLTGRWPDVTWWVVGSEQSIPAAESKRHLRDFCASADIGISGVDAALAETGTAIVSSGPGRSRLTSLLPPVHLALVPTSCLTTDIFTWTAARQGKLPASVTLITGPSKTADIEQTMAVGVHGPKRFIAILYDD